MGMIISLTSIMCVDIERQGCISQWLMSANTNTIGGRVSATSTSTAACLLQCLTTTGCNGVDWKPSNAVGQQCFLSGNWITGRNNGTQAGDTHYDLTKNNNCSSCSTAWIKSPNSFVSGTTVNGNAATIDACQQACTQSVTCSGYDWFPGKSKGNQCYLASTSSSLTPVTSPGVDHYDKVILGNCASNPLPQTTPGVCFKSWIPSANTNTPGGRANDATGLTECKYLCLLYDGCTGVDFTQDNAPGSQCFLSGSWNTGRNEGGAVGTTHYDFVLTGPNCPGSPATDSSATGSPSTDSKVNIPGTVGGVCGGVGGLLIILATVLIAVKLKTKSKSATRTPHVYDRTIPKNSDVHIYDTIQVAGEDVYDTIEDRDDEHADVSYTHITPIANQLPNSYEVLKHGGGRGPVSYDRSITTSANDNHTVLGNDNETSIEQSHNNMYPSEETSRPTREGFGNHLTPV